MNELNKKEIQFNQNTYRKLTPKESLYKKLGKNTDEQRKSIELMDAIMVNNIKRIHGDKGSEFNSLIDFNDPFNLDKNKRKEELPDSNESPDKYQNLSPADDIYDHSKLENN